MVGWRDRLVGGFERWLATLFGGKPGSKRVGATAEVAGELDNVIVLPIMRRPRARAKSAKRAGPSRR